MKRFIGFILAIILCVSCVAPATATAGHAPPPDTLVYTNEDQVSKVRSIDAESISPAREKYIELLSGGYRNGELKEKFVEYFGDLSPEYIMNNYETIFDTPADEVDEGLLEVICYTDEPDFDKGYFTDNIDEPVALVPAETTEINLVEGISIETEELPLATNSPSTRASNAVTSVTLVSKTETSVTLDLYFINSYSKDNALQMAFDGVNTWVLKDVRSSRVTINNLRLGSHYTFWSGTRYNNAWVNSDGLQLRTVYPAENLVSFSKSNMDFKMDKLLTDIWGPAMTEQFLAKTNNGYSVIFDLVGGDAPYRGAKMQFTNTRTLGPNIEGLSGQPIKWQSVDDETGTYTGIDHAYAMKKYNVPTTETPYHEISHNFDSYYWTFEAEALAYLKIYYYYSMTNDSMVVANLNRAWTGKDYKTYMKSYANRVSGRINYDAAMAKGVYSPYALAYNLGNIADIIGWNAYKETFRFFDLLTINEVPTTKLGKLNAFLSKLSDFSGRDVFALFTSQEKAIYEAYFGGKMEYVKVELPPPIVYNGVRYPAGSELTAVTSVADLNARTTIAEMEVVNNRLLFFVDILMPDDEHFPSEFIGIETPMYDNASDMVSQGKVLISKPWSTAEWDVLHFSVEGPAIESILLPVNRERLAGKNIYKLTAKYIETGDIYYFEDELPENVLFSDIKAVSYDAKIWPDTRNLLSKSLLWFFDYTNAEGEAQDPGDVGSYANRAASYTDWETMVPMAARNHLGRWMSVGLFEKNGQTQYYGYYTEVYKYPKDNTAEQDLYGWIATDVLTWTYNISGINDGQVYTVASGAPSEEATARATISLLHNGQRVWDTKTGQMNFEERLGPFFLGNVKVGIGFEDGAEIISTVTPEISAREVQGTSKLDVKAAFSFVAGAFKYGKIVNKAVSILGFIKETPAASVTSNFKNYGNTIEQHMQQYDDSLITYSSVTTSVNGKEYYLKNQGDMVTNITTFLNPAPSKTLYPDWNRRLGETRNIVFTFEFDVCTLGVKDDGYWGVVEVQKGLEYLTTNAPHLSLTFTMK